MSPAVSNGHHTEVSGDLAVQMGEKAFFCVKFVIVGQFTECQLMVNKSSHLKFLAILPYDSSLIAIRISE